MKCKINKLAEIYTIKEFNSFFVGFIRYFDDEVLVAELFDPYGNYDGYCITKLSYIYNICYKTKYLAKMAQIINDRKELNFKNIKDMIEYAVANNRLIEARIKRKHFRYCARIESIKDDLLTIKYINNCGSFYKEEVINIKNIEFLIVDARNLESLEKFLLLHSKQ